VSAFTKTEYWMGLKIIGYVVRQREIEGKTITENAYYLLSYANDVQCFAQSVRSIEVWKTCFIGLWMSVLTKTKVALEKAMRLKILL